MEISALERRLAARTPGLMDCTCRYAVLVPLVEREGALHVLYEVRALAMDRQPGEVCFPGGRMEGAESAEACALRETREELGIPERAVRLLGRLDFIAHRANFLMQPVLGIVEPEALERLRLNPDEVAETFLVPLDHLMGTRPLEYEYQLLPQTGDFPNRLVGIPEDYRWQPGRENVPVYLWQGRAIWGLTGRITRHLVRILSE